MLMHTGRAAKDVRDFVLMFLETFDLKGRPFHMAGEVSPGELP